MDPKLSIESYLGKDFSIAGKLKSKQSFSKAYLGGVSHDLPEADDDVILIEREIPVIDLCTPSVVASRQPLHRIDQFNTVSRSPPPGKENIDRLEKPGKPPVMCTICLKSAIGRRPQATPCGHVFCLHCIRSVMIAKKECPTCKKFVCSVRPLYI